MTAARATARSAATGAPRAVRARVPASSANLGPGFDTLGLALGMHDEVELAVRRAGEPTVVEVRGEGQGRVPCDERHLVLRAARATFERAGVAAPPLRLRCHNVVPHSRGLGSSSAAAVAGIVAARALLPPGHAIDDATALDLAAGFDGHADNVAACLLGGLVVTWGRPGEWGAVRLDVHRSVAPVVCVSRRTSSTEATRGLLPDRVPHADAAFTAARAALAVHALTADPTHLLTATEDRLHQPYRRPAYPETAALVEALRSRGVAAVVSGAGPTVLALTLDGRLPEGLPGAATDGFSVRALDVDPLGAVVEPL